MKYLSEEVWGRLPLPDFRARFFIETFSEKLSLYTPHFYQSRLMSVMSSCSEVLTYVEEYRNNEKNGGYILSALDEIDSCWATDRIAQKLFAHMDYPRRQVFKRLRGGDLSTGQLLRLCVLCQAILSREEEYVAVLLTELQEALTGECDLSKAKRITADIYSLTGLYITHLLNKGYSPTYLFNRAEMFTRPKNYSGRSFQEQFQFITERLRSHKSGFDVYYALRAHRPSCFLDIADDPDFHFENAIPHWIQGQDLEKFKKDIEPNVIAKATIESTDYVSAAFRTKEKLDKLLDAVTALEVNPRIKVSPYCVVNFGAGLHTKTLNIDLLVSFLSSESGTYFSTSDTSIRDVFPKLNEDGKEHLGRSLRYLRLARDSISLEQKLLNLWIALESLFSDAEQNILVNVLEYVPHIYALSALRRRVGYLRELLIKNAVPTTERFRSMARTNLQRFENQVSEGNVFAMLRDERTADDLFNSLGTKEHLKFKLLSVFEELRTNASINERIEQSSIDVTRQLRRIYFLRNRMAHTGHYGNIRPQLVTHLLDYVAVCYMAISASASHAKQKERYSIGDLLAAYKIGTDVVANRCKSNNMITTLEELIPVPLI